MEKKYLVFEKPIESIGKKICHLKGKKEEHFIDTQSEIVTLQKQLENKKREIFSNLSPWQTVQVARHPDRPHTLDYVNGLLDDFVELHGDRIYGDDPAIIAGFGKFRGMSIAVIGHQKGREVKENVRRCFGMGHPEGYKKALRVMILAERFGFPIVTLIDTPGAHPDMESEERGQALSIANSLCKMSVLKTPILCIIIGEGGSGGALGIGVGDRVLMQEFAVYSVISPEGCASILWKDQKAAEKAATALKITAADIYELGIIDGIIEEPLGGAHSQPEAAVEIVGKYMSKYISELQTIKRDELVELRYQKYRRIGFFGEGERGDTGSEKT